MRKIYEGNTIQIFDTTLREGDQSIQPNMTTYEKLKIAYQLELLGVDHIEAGFPISSKREFISVKNIAKKVRKPTICALARTVKEDIYRAWEAIEDAKYGRIHTFISTSPIHMEKKLGKTQQEVYEMAVEGVSYARNLLGTNGGEVEFSPEDASRSEPEFLCKIIEGAISAGADVINFPDTVGCGQTEELIRLIGTVQKNVPAINNLIQSVHFHNDLGNAVTNSLYAVKQLGIRQVECAVNGAGERSGNAALEEIVANIVVRSDYYGLSTNIDTKQIGNTSRLVYRIMGLNVPYNKPIVGTNSLRHSAGIHQDGVTKDKRTYEIMTPEDWGWMGESVVISSRSGKAGVKAVLEKLGYNLTDKEVELTTKKMKELGDTKKTAIYPEDLILILEDEVRKPPQIISLEDYRVKTARRGKRNSLARAWVRRGEDVSSAEVAADGPIDALFGAINKALRTRAELKTYEVKSFTPGRKSIGEVTVRVGPDDKMFIGRASSTDIIGASGDAYVRALNKMLVGEEAIINGYISDIERQFGDAEKDARREAGNK